MLSKFIGKILRGAALFKEAFGSYKWQIAVLTGIGFLSGVLEGIGANALIPLFSFVVGESGEKDPISQMIESAFGFLGIGFTLKYLLIFIALLFVARSIILFVGNYIQFKITYDYEKNTRLALLGKALRSEWQYLLEQKIGHLEKVLSSEIHTVALLLKNVSTLILIVASLLVYVFVAVNISLSITAITLGVGGVLMLVFHPLVEKIRAMSRVIAEDIREIAHFINENTLGMKTVKVMAAEKPVLAAGETRFEMLRKMQLKRSVLGNVFGAFFQPFGVLFILFLFSFSYKTSSFHLPSFIAIVYLIQRIFSQVQTLQTAVQSVFSSIPYVEHVLSYQDRLLRNKEEDSGKRGFVFDKEFSFHNVSFGYGKGKDILSAVSFRIRKGAFVGLVGSSGAGKTTIVDLILRLFTQDRGDILLDGSPVSDVDLHTFRRNVGYVSQDIHLLNDTIASNIRFFDHSITDDEVVRAAKQANIYDFVNTLPERFSSVVGERGVRLSAGQRQRVVIARVLARNPKFLVLDEATSALDNESEKRIQEVIENLKGKITVLIIAHRLGTVMNCDTLLVLDDGKIIEEGRPDELLKNKESYFFKMYNIRK